LAPVFDRFHFGVNGFAHIWREMLLINLKFASLDHGYMEVNGNDINTDGLVTRSILTMDDNKFGALFVRASKIYVSGVSSLIPRVIEVYTRSLLRFGGNSRLIQKRQCFVVLDVCLQQILLIAVEFMCEI
jgi:hypothetical protein